MIHTLAEQTTFVGTDIEADGHSPLRNSMLSFASVAVSHNGTKLGEFESVLARRPERTPGPQTMAGTMRGQDYLNWGMQRAPHERYGNIPHSEMNADLPRIDNATGAYS